MSVLLRTNRILAITRIIIQPERYAGHSKWQNIRHTKASNDAKRATLISKHCLHVRKAVIAGGGPDPKLNSLLANAFANAQKDNVPKDTLLRAVERTVNAKLTKHTLEVIGPANIFMLIELETENIARSRHDLKSVLKKFKGSSIVREGTLRHSFEEKGMVKIAKKDKNGSEINFEKAEEMAIEAGAEEVTDDDDDCWTFLTVSADVYNVKGYIEREKADVEIIACEVLYKPIVSVPLSDEASEVVSNLLESISTLPEVNKVYDNAA